jgi:uncharacterized protein (TIGR02284 family)
MQTTKKVTDMLNEVIECLYDSINGYKESVQAITDLQMKNLFEMLANQRNTMLDDIKIQLQAMQQEPQKSGSVVGALHRMFLDLKSLLTGGDIVAIVKEIKRGENYTMSIYKKALEKDLPANIRGLLTRQLEQIECNLAKIDTLVSIKM